MATIEIESEITAPIERVFDLSRSIDAHVASTAGTSERAVAGVTRGLIGPGEEVTWEARHFGILQRLTTHITGYERPFHFRDSMVPGTFARFDHDHFFEAFGGRTRVRERFDYDAPLGPLGRVAEVLFLTRYMRRFLATRLDTIRALAESERWREFLP